MVAGAKAWPKRLVNTGHMAALAAVERRIPYWSLERIERLQSRRLQSIVRHAYETVPYYRRTMEELGLRPGDFQTVADLAKLPLIDATTVRRDPDQFASTAYDDRSRHAFHSSGNLTHSAKTIYWDNASVLRKLPRDERDRVVLARLSGKRWRRRQLHVHPQTGTRSIVTATDAQTWVSRASWSGTCFRPRRHSRSWSRRSMRSNRSRPLVRVVRRPFLPAIWPIPELPPPCHASGTMAGTCSHPAGRS